MKALIEIPDNAECLQIKITLEDGSTRWMTVNAEGLDRTKIECQPPEEDGTLDEIRRIVNGINIVPNQARGKGLRPGKWGTRQGIYETLFYVRCALFPTIMSGLKEDYEQNYKRRTRE